MGPNICGDGRNETGGGGYDDSEEEGKNFGTVSTITTEADQGKEQLIEGAAGHQNWQAAESKIPLVELGDLMSKWEQLDKKLGAARRTARN